MVRIVGTIPRYQKDENCKICEIERIVEKSNGDIIILPEEYFGGPKVAYEKESSLVDKLEKIARERNVGLVVGVIEKEDDKKYQSIWFFNEKGKFLGSEKKYNLAGYEMDPDFYNLSANPSKFFERGAYEIKGTKGTGVICWEVYDLHTKVACDSANIDWIANLIKFPINYFPVYERSGNNYVIRQLVKSEEEYVRWMEKLQELASDTLSLVIASCNPTFPGLENLVPKDAKALACILHPKNGLVRTTNLEGMFVSFDFEPETIRNIRESNDLNAKAWRIRHKYDNRKVKIERSG
ncbi:MAG: hypothetical protein OH319_01225 [Candidatus Parvarchaeota archaeon]|nr:hypothetical protein [Candidatus Jingweiarchaeum tengchongense]MCW1297807.1 hypothetical protein [Candidatus Jingweiarchaeum tengchongense]MCW1299817.1 hypothetical protein [Candidatus Jingweiarchaeum tengchongense]MCW1304212.1 hypothetical protein [Candidatus Jingweiarchaeum tengchongense]MCW1305240.1 hypothetical protein [Candidatus Jingweiarchaeum tengchongense]